MYQYHVFVLIDPLMWYCIWYAVYKNGLVFWVQIQQFWVLKNLIRNTGKKRIKKLIYEKFEKKKRVFSFFSKINLSDFTLFSFSFYFSIEYFHFLSFYIIFRNIFMKNESFFFNSKWFSAKLVWQIIFSHV